MAYKKSRGRLLGDLFGKASIFTRQSDDSIKIDTDSSGVVSSSTTVANTAFQSFVANTNTLIATKVDSSSLANVATSGSYNDLTDTPTIPSTTGLATETYVDTAVSNIVNTAPTTLNTLNELAAALNDDANFATTVTTSLGGKASNSFVTSTYTTNTAFQSFVANTNAYIAASAGSGGLSNTEVEDIVDSRINVLDLGDVVGTDGNVGQILISYGDGTAYWSNNNPLVDTSALATWSALTATNTAIRTLISDRVQVANLNSTLSNYWPSANVISYVAAAAAGGATVSTSAPNKTTNASAGDLWVDTTDNYLYVCIDDTTNQNVWWWADLSTPPPPFQGSNYGYASSGYYTSAIDKFPFSSATTNATDVGDLSVTRYYLSGQSSATYGYSTGHASGPLANVIDRFPFSTDGNAVDVGNLTTTTYQWRAGQSSAEHGFVSGGGTSPAHITTIERFSFATGTENSASWGNLTVARKGAAGISDGENGYGYTSGGTSPISNVIDKFPFASGGTATDVGDLTVARSFVAGQSSSTYGYTSGGTPPTSNVIDRFPFVSSANATDVGNLTASRFYAAGQSSSTYGYTSGGFPTPTYGNVIDRYPFASGGNASDVGDLTVGRYSPAGQQY